MATAGKKCRKPRSFPRSLVNHFDSQNVMFWSDVEQCYVLYARHSEGKRRAQAKATSKDFIHWTAMTLMTYSDTGATIPSQHLYTNQTHPYYRAPHLYIALPGRFQAGRAVLTEQQAAAVDAGKGGGGARDVADGALMTSRAGTAIYDFTFLESFVRPGIGYSNWTSRNNYPAQGVVQTGPNEMSLYVQRNYGQQDRTSSASRCASTALPRSTRLTRVARWSRGRSASPETGWRSTTRRRPQAESGSKSRMPEGRRFQGSRWPTVLKLSGTRSNV